jgi:hypothetical protein
MLDMASRLLAARCARYRDEGHSKPLWLGLDGHPGRAKRPVQRVSETADGEHCGEQVSGKAFHSRTIAQHAHVLSLRGKLNGGLQPTNTHQLGVRVHSFGFYSLFSGAKVVRIMHIACHKFPTHVLAKLRVHKGRASDDSRQALFCPA